MAATLSADALKRITYSRYLLSRAKSHYREGDSLSGAETVLALHDAAEILMRVITDHLNVHPRYGFMEFWTKVEAAGQPLPPNKGSFDRLNALRVGFKHKGNLPNASLVADFIPIVEEFCREVSQQYLSVDYASVGLVDLIENGKARELIRKAEAHRRDEEWEECMCRLSDAMAELYKETEVKLGTSGVSNLRMPLLRGDAGELMNEVIKAIRGLRFELQMVQLGISGTRRRKFNSMMPGRSESMSGRVQYQQWGGRKEICDDDAGYCIQYVIDFGLRIQTFPTP